MFLDQADFTYCRFQILEPAHRLLVLLDSQAMPPKFAKKLSASASKDLVDSPEEVTPTPKEKQVRHTTPAKRKAKEQKDEAGEDSKKKRAKKAKEGPYTCYKEQGSIPEPELPRRSEKAGKSLHLMAWNVGGLRAFLKSRIPDLQEAIKDAKPHVFGIMEHKLTEGVADSDSALQELSTALPEYHVACVNYSTAKKGYSGALVMLHKDCPKPIHMTAEDLPSAKNEGRMVVVEFEALYVILCYVPNSGDGLKRLRERIDQWDVELRERLQNLAKKKHVLLMGDLNVAHQDKDIWNVEAPHVPKSAGTTAEERESFGKLLDSGFKDSFSLRHPEAMGAFTYWSIRAGNRKVNRGLRLDYVLVSESLVPDEESKTSGMHLWDAFHLPSVATGDHCPVGAILTV